MILSTSPEGRAYIERKEGLRLHAYQDIAGIWTIGYGHTGPEVVPGLVWTKEQCDGALTRRLSDEFEPAVNTVCGDVPTTQGQFDAMVSLAYNIGTHGFSRSEVARLHRQHEYDKAGDAFEHWDHVNGRVNEALHNRRVEEAQTYLDASPVRLPPSDQPEAPGVIMTPMGSDPTGYGKIAGPAVTGVVAGPLTWWAKVKYGLELPAEVAVDIVSALGMFLVWLIPHNGGR